MDTGFYGKPNKYTELEFKYWRKAAIAYDRGQKIRHFVYRRLAKYYERKHLKNIMSS